MTTVRVEIWNGNRIAARADRRFPGDYDMSKSIPGGRWNPDHKFWHYPLSVVTCRLLRKTYDDMLFIGPELALWARENIAKNKVIEDLGKSYDAELQRIPEVAPRMAEAMANRTYQRVGARFGAEAGSFLLADEPTLGKTIQYLGAIIEADLWHGNHLITAPLSAVETVWAEEIMKWTDGVPYPLTGPKANRQMYLDAFLDSETVRPKFLIVNPEMLRIVIAQWCNKCQMWEPPKKSKDMFPMEHYTEGHDTKPKIQKCDWPEIHDVEWQSICVDEAHKSLLGVQGPNAKSRTQQGEGYVALRTSEGGLRIASTGTPLKGRAINFFPTLWWLRPKEFTSKWGFADAFLEIKDNGFGKTIGDIRPDREAALLEALRGVMLRRTKKEVQPDLPDDMYQDHWVHLHGEHAKQYSDLISEGEISMEGGALTATGVLAEYTRQKQFSFGPWKRKGSVLVPAEGSPKMELLIELLARRGVTGDKETEFRLDGGFKYIIGSQFTLILDFIEDELEKIGIKTLKITGSVTGKKRKDAVQGFQSEHDLHRVLLVNTIAGGAALTLDAWCDEMFVLDETWIRDEQIQLEGRIRNRDVEKRVAVRTYHYIRTRGTIEEEISESGLTQDEFQKYILDRSRGVSVKSRREA